MPRAASLIALLLLSAAVAAPALSAVAPGSCRPGNVFQNEELRVWFHGSKGFVKVFDANGTGDEGEHYAYHTGALVERDGAGAEVARMGLERAFPRTGGCELRETDERVEMTLTVTDDVKAGGGAAGEATVVFSYHFNKTSRGAKFDLHVASWPWQSSDGELSYEFDVEVSSGTVEGAENGVGFRGADGTSRGYVEWAPDATAEYADGRQETAVVDGEVRSEGSRAGVTLRFTNATAGYERLVYDPWVGVGAYVVAGGLLVGLAPVEDALPRAVRSLL